MTLRDIETVYGVDKVGEILAMMGAGWSSEDTPEEIYEAHKTYGVTMEEAQEIHKIIEKIEESEAE